MFHNKEDIEYFKPVKLRTRCGRLGHIKESLGMFQINRIFAFCDLLILIKFKYFLFTVYRYTRSHEMRFRRSTEIV